jgi:hypothetical protein
MSSDPLADMARCTYAFAMELREMLIRNSHPATNSPAATESRGEPFADEWSACPGQEVFANSYLVAASCADHLLGLANLLKTGDCLNALFTLTRAAAEASALGCYLTDDRIDARERLRRNMNHRLIGLSEQISIERDIPIEASASEVAICEQRIDEIARSAKHHAFAFRRARAPSRPAYLDEAQPSAMRLMARALNPEVPAVGQAFQRLLSAVAHTRAHGLKRINDPALLADPDSGETLGIHPVEPRLLAVELVAGPACAVNMTTGLRWFSGYDWDSLRAPIREMLGTWSRIGHMPGLPE